MKLNVEKQKKLAKALAGVVIAVAVTWYAGTQFVTNSKSKYEREAKSLTEENEKRRNEILKEKDNREKSKIFHERIAILEAKMPKGNPETWLVKQLSEIAGRQKLQLSSSTMQPVKEFSDFRFKNQPYQMVGFHVEFVGDFNQIGKLIEDIENNQPLMEIHEIAITAGSEKAKHLHKVVATISEPSKL